jgi:hypothetical protein
MLRIALNLGRAAVFDGDEDTAGVRTIVRTGGMNHVLHALIIGEVTSRGDETKSWS